ncbi:hypothetical protein [Pendulispora albinea]|uniref:Uncharacterized protein n=1 Tax=Pendulispora albinea TaxID=2741071 RepID=A0ABZ2M065_9BACT
MKISALPASLLALTVVAFAVLVGLGKIEAAAFVALATNIIHALLPALVQRNPRGIPPVGRVERIPPEGP